MMTNPFSSLFSCQISLHTLDRELCGTDVKNDAHSSRLHTIFLWRSVSRKEMPPGREHSLGLDDDFASSLPVPPRQQPALPTVPPTTKCKQDPQLVRRVVDLAKNGATLSDIDAALHAEGFCNSIGTLNRKQMAPVVRRRGALAYPLCCGHCRPKQGFGAAAAASSPSGGQAADWPAGQQDNSRGPQRHGHQ